MLDMLRVEAKKAKDIIEKHDFVRIYTHYDVDGISSSAIIATALLRMGKQFQITFLKGLNEGVMHEDGLAIFTDMGSSYPEVISEIETDVIVIDHHFPIGKIEAKKEFAHVNPHLAGFDGSFELSASGSAFVVAESLGENYDLTAIALLGMIGDKQKISGGNEEIIKLGIEKGYIVQSDGLRIISGKLSEILKLSIEPYLGFNNDRDVEDFLKKVGLDGDKNVDDLSKEEEIKLANAITLRVLRNNAYEGVVESFIGKKFIIPKELIKNAVMMSEVVNACGRKGAQSIGFALCMRDDRYLEKSIKIWRDFQKQIAEELVKRRDDVKEGFCIRYLIMENAPSTSTIATIYSRYLFGDKPFIAINVKKDGKVKVSARANEKIAERIDLAEVMRKASEKVGGKGGGHRVAAGANISSENIEEFIKEVDRLCC